MKLYVNKLSWRLYAILLLLSLCIAGIAKSQSISYKLKMIELYDLIQAKFYISQNNYYRENAAGAKQENSVSYLWPLCAMFDATNEMGAVNGNDTLLANIFSIIKKYYSNKKPAPGYASYPPALGGGSRFYDDNQWIGITAMNAYEKTKNPQWLHVGKDIYKFMMTGFDTTLGGGLYWEEGNYKSKNTCSNGPGIILGLQLYKATKEKQYMDTALILYNWVNKHLQSPGHLYYDNIRVKDRKLDEKKYSYNSGTMLQANIYLFEITKEKKYLNEAVTIADAATDYFYKHAKFIDNYWFNTVLLRAFEHLLLYNPDTKYIKAFEAALKNAINTDKNANGLMGKTKPLNLVAQGGMLEILARYALLQMKGLIE